MLTILTSQLLILYRVPNKRKVWACVQRYTETYNLHNLLCMYRVPQKSWSSINKIIFFEQFQAQCPSKILFCGPLLKFLTPKIRSTNQLDCLARAKFSSLCACQLSNGSTVCRKFFDMKNCLCTRKRLIPRLLTKPLSYSKLRESFCKYFYYIA